jgi:hypothetical protein
VEGSRGLAARAVEAVSDRVGGAGRDVAQAELRSKLPGLPTAIPPHRQQPIQHLLEQPVPAHLTTRWAFSQQSAPSAPNRHSCRRFPRLPLTGNHSNQFSLQNQLMLQELPKSSKQLVRDRCPQQSSSWVAAIRQPSVRSARTAASSTQETAIGRSNRWPIQRSGRTGEHTTIVVVTVEDENGIRSLIWKQPQCLAGCTA